MTIIEVYGEAVKRPRSYIFEKVNYTTSFIMRVIRVNSNKKTAIIPQRIGHSDVQGV